MPGLYRLNCLRLKSVHSESQPPLKFHHMGNIAPVAVQKFMKNPAKPNKYYFYENAFAAAHLKTQPSIWLFPLGNPPLGVGSPIAIRSS
ncbi:MAG: hypothetical protein NWR47_04760 [Aestuariivirgaceae bacterium]|nr:hypothetical protein [Aestuariivirgaceae bacterium]